MEKYGVLVPFQYFLGEIDACLWYGGSTLWPRGSGSARLLFAEAARLRCFVLFRRASMGRFGHHWRQAFLSALNETEPDKLPGRVEYAITALERRYAEWGSDPGTQAELNAIHRAISALERLMNEKLVRSEEVPPRNSGEISEEMHYGQLGHIRHLFLILRS